MRACQATAQRRGRGAHRVYEAADDAGLERPGEGVEEAARDGRGDRGPVDRAPVLERALERVAERCVAGLGGRQLGDRADAEGVHEPRRLPDPGVQVEALADALLGQQQRHVVGAGGQPRAGQPALGEHRDQLEAAQRRFAARTPAGPIAKRSSGVSGSSPCQTPQKASPKPPWCVAVAQSTKRPAIGWRAQRRL